MAPAKKKTIKQEEKFVTVEQFSEFQKTMESSMMQIVDALKTQATQPVAPAVATPVVETPLDRDIRKAAPDAEPVNTAWREKAEEILGDALDRCEVLFPKKGGTLFTVVIKKEYSNAPENYMQFYKEDRRTKEIGNEGLEGVEQWCKLVKSNLERKQPNLN